MDKLKAEEFCGEVEEIPANVCGRISDRYIIEAPIDDIVKRDFSMCHVYDCNQPELNLFLVIPRHDVKQNRRNTTVHRMLRVLQITRNRSVHFPRVILSGRISKLVFGADGEQAFERDPEWPSRPMAIIESDNTILGTLPCFSNNGALPVETSLQIGIGIFRAIAALHRAGFVHRLISPYSFTVLTPLTPDSIQRGVTIIDFSFVIPFPIMPRKHVPFVGTMRYSSMRAHFGREQGPSDDVISIIYLIAEFISGRLPWRSVRDEKTIVALKQNFCKSDCFRKLPRELRRLYRDMYSIPGPAAIDHQHILEQFISALSRKNPDLQKKLPTYLNTEAKRIIPRHFHRRGRKNISSKNNNGNNNNVENGAAAAQDGGGDARNKIDAAGDGGTKSGVGAAAAPDGNGVVKGGGSKDGVGAAAEGRGAGSKEGVGAKNGVGGENKDGAAAAARGNGDVKGGESKDGAAAEGRGAKSKDGGTKSGEAKKSGGSKSGGAAGAQEGGGGGGTKSGAVAAGDGAAANAGSGDAIPKSRKTKTL